MQDPQRATQSRVVVWQPVEYEGLEHLTLSVQDKEVVADGLVIGSEEGRFFRLHYRVTMDASFRVRSAELTLHGSEDQRLVLQHDEDGDWRGAKGDVLPNLTGCIDIDITATPFTNMLPIRRLDLQPGESVDLNMVYFWIPEMKVTRDPQRYTCLTRTLEQSVYRFESLDSDFVADITVDADGLVVDYPGLFRRVWSDR